MLLRELGCLANIPATCAAVVLGREAKQTLRDAHMTRRSASRDRYGQPFRLLSDWRGFEAKG